VSDVAATGAAGLDVVGVSLWLEANVPELEGPFSFELIAGGRSNLTYGIRTATGDRLVLRRPPTGHVLESAHDVAREHRIITALRDSAVPVPRTVGLCEDRGVTGAPFYVMEFVDGVVLRDEAAVDAALPRDRRPAAAESLIDAMVGLHAVRPADVGLEGLSKHEGFADRQLRRWHKQWTSSRFRDLPAIEEGHRRLSGRVPPQTRTGLVHGDLRLDNAVFGDRADVRSVLDWELCTLGDPLADLGLLLVSWLAPTDDPLLSLAGAPTRAGGFPDRSALVERYALRSGADVSAVDFWVALSAWKLACIAEGIHARYAAGVMGDDHVDLESLALQAPLLADTALAVLDGASL